MALSVETCVATHQGDRKEQQDRVSLFPHPQRPGMLMAVLADGMGGHSGGALAAEQVVHRARHNFADYAPESESPREFLDSIVHEAHTAVKLTRFTSEQDPHTTAVVFLLAQGRAAWAHCGDSRIYHVRHGRLAVRSQDHSLVGEWVRQGRITQAQAETHPQRNILVSCLGAEQAPVIDHGEVDQLEAGDVFLLCSDGLWAYFPEDELVAILTRQSARQAAEELVAQARARGMGAGDNISLALVRLVER